MRKDIEAEYLDIISTVNSSDFSVRRVPVKADSLPKVARKHRDNQVGIQRKPLAKRKKLTCRDVTLEKDYLEAELPIMKSVSEPSTYVFEEKLEEHCETKKPVMPKKKWSSKKFWSFLGVGLFVFIAVYSGTKLNLWNDENAESDRQLTEIHSMVVERVIEPEDEVKVQVLAQNTASGIDYSKLALVDVDFSKLVKVNPDTVAYIKINGLDVSAPIVQTTDNDFYLNHSYDKTANSAGWIFGDYRNDWDILKDNTIVYGHNRMNYAMFGSLKLILDENWNKNKDNHYIYISTATANMVFQMFSAYTIPTESYYLQNEFSSKDKYQEFLDTLIGRTQVDFETSVSSDDKIITLSTCYTNTSKTVVHAKLVKMQEK